MKHRYIVNFSTSNSSSERTMVMVAENKQEVQSSLEDEFADFEEELRILSISEDNKKRNFVLDF